MKQEEYNRYMVGAAKRKFKMGKDDFIPGTLITKMNAQKATQNNEKVSRETKVAILGAI